MMDLEGAKAKEWWTMEREAKAKPFDFQKALETLFTAVAAELAKPDTALDRNTVFSGIETKLRDIMPVEDQIAKLFDRIPQLDQMAVLSQLMAAVPAPAVQSQPDADELQSEAA